MHTKYKHPSKDPHYTHVMHYIQQLHDHTDYDDIVKNTVKTCISFILLDKCLKPQRLYSPEQLLKLAKQKDTCYKRHTGYEVVERRREWYKLFQIKSGKSERGLLSDAFVVK